MAWRESIEIPLVKHGQNPIPFASKVGSMVFTGGIMGADPSTGETPDDVDAQVRNCFTNLVNTMAKAGGSLGDVGHITVFLRDIAYRAKVNPVWVEHFPDESSRPARHTIMQENLPYAIQIEAIANIEPR